MGDDHRHYHDVLARAPNRNDLTGIAVKRKIMAYQLGGLA